MLFNPSQQVKAQTSSRSSTHGNRPSTTTLVKPFNRGVRCSARVAEAFEAPTASVAHVASGDLNQCIREGHYEAPLVQEQASKQDSEQGLIADVLAPLAPGASVDALVVGCGPAGIYLAAQMAKKGLNVGLVGPDAPFVNNYGVWVDEFNAIGLGHTLEKVFDDALCYFQEGKGVCVGRAYGRVSRRLLRSHLLQLAQEAGVKYMAATVEDVTVSDDGKVTNVTCSNGTTLNSRLVTLASGQAAGRLLKYEDDAPTVAAQTAYGIEAEVEGYDAAYDASLMLFMDFRRHHTGLWDGAARYLEPGNHPNAGEGLWGSSEEVPSFLYAMPLGGNRVFLEETCLVAKPALPFAVLKRRLERRLAAMKVTVTKVHEEEWSYIPVGGPLPVNNQKLTAFGAAANLVHPATGFSVSRSLRQAPEFAAAAATALSSSSSSVQEVSSAVWDSLWSRERRQQAAFHVFGMELLTQLDLSNTNDFFKTFFALPPFYWKGFLGSNLSSMQLMAFALLTFVYAPFNIKAKLVMHLLADPAGSYLIKRYLGQSDNTSTSSSSSTVLPAAVDIPVDSSIISAVTATAAVTTSSSSSSSATLTPEVIAEATAAQQ